MSAPRRHLAASPFNQPEPPPARPFEVGERVAHDSHGLGRVVTTSGTTAVTVDFGTCVLHLALPCRALQVL